MVVEEKKKKTNLLNVNYCGTEEQGKTLGYPQLFLHVMAVVPRRGPICIRHLYRPLVVSRVVGRVKNMAGLLLYLFVTGTLIQHPDFASAEDENVTADSNRRGEKVLRTNW